MQVARETLHTAETHKPLGEHSNAFQLLDMAGHQKQRGKLYGGRAQGTPGSGVEQDISVPTEKLLLFAPTFPQLLPPEGSINGLVHQLPFPSSLAYLLLLPSLVDSCQTANHSTCSTQMHPVLPRLLEGQRPLAPGGRTGQQEFLYMHCALFSVKPQSYKTASHREDTAQHFSS